MRRVGITTTIPVEVVFAAGAIPVDLNNVFITGEQSARLVEEAEMAGYPRNICGWIKGLYGTLITRDDIHEIIAVTQGDCSNTHALMETLHLRGKRIIPFAYPYDRDADLLKLQIEKLMDHFGTDWAAVNQMKARLDRVRAKVHELDRLTWEENRVSGFHNHLYQVSCSDFNGDVEQFEAELDDFLARLPATPVVQEKVRLGYIGVPPIFTDLYDYLEGIGARVVFNEVQRQFSMPFKDVDLVEQYRRYTYPYDVFGRIKDIQEEIGKRRLDGIIHYVQSFCFRQIEDIIFQEQLEIPVLTIEGDKPGKLDARTRMRIDSFVEMLR